MNSIRSKFAYFSLFWAAFHFTVEMTSYVIFGSFLPMLIVDLIAISLLSLGAYLYLKKNWSFGLLCGAWGFEACLNYRAFFIRLSGVAGETAGAFTQIEIIFLGITLVIVFSAFIFTLYACAPKFEDANNAADLPSTHRPE